MFNLMVSKGSNIGVPKTCFKSTSLPRGTPQSSQDLLDNFKSIPKLECLKNIMHLLQMVF